MSSLPMLLRLVASLQMESRHASHCCDGCLLWPAFISTLLLARISLMVSYPHSHQQPSFLQPESSAALSLFYSCLCTLCVGKCKCTVCGLCGAGRSQSSLWCCLPWTWDGCMCSGLSPTLLAAPGKTSGRVYQTSQQCASAGALACFWEYWWSSQLSLGQGHPVCILLQDPLSQHPDPSVMWWSRLAVVQWPEFTFGMIS